MLLKANVTDLAKAVNKWNGDYSLGLRDLGAMSDKAAWGIGNRIVTAEQLTPIRGEPMARIELDDYRWESPNAEVNAVWPKLQASLKTHFEELPLPFYPPGETDRIVQKTSQSMKTRAAYPDRPLTQEEMAEIRNTAKGEWERERERRAKITETEWAAAFFGAALGDGQNNTGDGQNAVALDRPQLCEKIDRHFNKPSGGVSIGNVAGGITNSIIASGNVTIGGASPHPDRPLAPAEASSTETLARLHQNIAAFFGDEELRSLCFDLGVDYADLPAEGKDGKARELVAYLERRGRIPELVETCRKLRPNVEW